MKTSHLTVDDNIPPDSRCYIKWHVSLLHTCIAAVAYMVSVLPIDVSQYAEDIVKNAVAHLSSNAAATREHTLLLFTALSKQCSDLGPVEQVSKQLFTALKSMY